MDQDMETTQTPLSTFKENTRGALKTRLKFDHEGRVFYQSKP